MDEECPKYQPTYRYENVYKLVTEVLGVTVTVQRENYHRPLFCTKLEDEPAGITCVGRSKDWEPVLWTSCDIVWQ